MLIYVASALILMPYIIYFFNILINKDKKVTDDNGFNVTKDIVSSYDKINIIETTGLVTYYNPKRKVIKLNSKCYYGSNLSVIAISLLEAGISVTDNKKNKYLKIFKVLFSNLKLLYIFPLIICFINTQVYELYDAVVGLILVILCTTITYMFNNIIILSFDWVSNNIEKVKSISKRNKELVINYIKNIVFMNRFIFFGELLIIIRMVAIIISK